MSAHARSIKLFFKEYRTKVLIVYINIFWLGGKFTSNRELFDIIF